MITNKEIANNIKRIRKDNKITQKKLGEMIDKTESMISRYESGDVSFSLDILSQIAGALGVSIDYLIGQNNHVSWSPVITDKDEKDIKKAIDAIKNQLSSGTGLMYDGEPMDDESMETVLAAIEVAERTAVLAAKKKFTPNKYKKD